MALKTNFSFRVQYTAGSNTGKAQRDEFMDSLQATLQQLLAAQDAEAEVLVSNGQRGDGNKLVELTTTLQDAQLAHILKEFSEKNGVSVTALE
ncbi:MULTISPECIES: hypothetical protein [unclassified Polaromonas]|uniref:hypothetical protein n=1 Tax=unclassified Polaromonas TaxID=2638319 RepID=UPI0018CB07FF|nr:MULTISPECIES: hypothetical protein [unclassified Polaromonas]MBG6073960.1 hypothetical protein [Polaromonas sp. CG_9.7]MBG6115939.1 hypothetical protein [Polaromonas sp. CG_9.2]MDH6183518.1 hypothetical protein [Polaromonas sp. CG_23.6]